MNFILVMVTILSSQVCEPEKNTLSENFKFEKPSIEQTKEKVTYKKIPTKWIKITKKPN